MYKTVEEMQHQWSVLPGVPVGDNPQSRLLKFAHCHEAVMWYTQHLSAQEQQKFAKNIFLPSLPNQLLSPLGGGPLELFYTSKVFCPECNVQQVLNKQPLNAAADSVNKYLQAQPGLQLVACENLSIYSLRYLLKALLSVKNKALDATYPIYTNKTSMAADWAQLPGVQPGNNLQSLMIKHAHCYQAVMWFTQYLNPKDQATFAASYFLPLLPANELEIDGNGAIAKFYLSKVKCPQCVTHASPTSIYV